MKAHNEAGDLIAQTYLLDRRTTTWFMTFLFSLSYTGRDYTARKWQKKHFQFIAQIVQEANIVSDSSWKETLFLKRYQFCQRLHNVSAYLDLQYNNSS